MCSNTIQSNTCLNLVSEPNRFLSSCSNLCRLFFPSLLHRLSGELFFLLGLLCFVSVSSLSTEHVSIFGCFIMAQSDSVNTGINTSPSSPKSAATQDATISSSTASAALVPLSNTQQVINLKLTNNNYLFRRMQMKPYLIGQGVFSFFDGSTQYPSSYATDSSCSLLSV